MTMIEWTHMPGFKGESWNPVTGCTKVSAGCKHCYAERDFPRPYARTGRKFTDIATHPDRLDRPLRATKPRCYFVNSMSDLFHEAVPDEFIDQVFAVMALSPQHRFIVLTKRPERMRDYLLTIQNDDKDMQRWANYGPTLARSPCAAGAIEESEWPLPNVYLGVSVEDQPTADERIWELLGTPAAARIVSFEPALERIDVKWAMPWLCNDGTGRYQRSIDWVIVGGESGPKARRFDVAWARSTITQCRAAGVPVFVKQLGARPVYQCGRCAGTRHRGMCKMHGVDRSGVGHGDDGLLRLFLKDRKGKDMLEWPEDLRVREWPHR